MSLYPENINLGQKYQTGVNGAAVDAGFVAHFQVSAANAVAKSANGVHALANLGAAAADITTGITNPAVPRNLSIVANVSGVTGNVVFTGTNYDNETITETIALNGVTPVLGLKAFKTVTNIHVPAQVHTPVKQVESQQVTAGAGTKSGNITVTITSANMTNSPKDVVVAVLHNDTAAQVAQKIVDALNLDVNVTAEFIATLNVDSVVLTERTQLANDGTLAIAGVDTDTTGCTFGSSLNSTAGVPFDKVSVGWDDKLGLPNKLLTNTVLYAFLNSVLESAAPTVAVSSAAMESNTVILGSALNGNAVDIYYIF